MLENTNKIYSLFETHVLDMPDMWHIKAETSFRPKHIYKTFTRFYLYYGNYEVMYLGVYDPFYDDKKIDEKLAEFTDILNYINKLYALFPHKEYMKVWDFVYPLHNYINIRYSAKPNDDKFVNSLYAKYKSDNEFYNEYFDTDMVSLN